MTSVPRGTPGFLLAVLLRPVRAAADIAPSRFTSEAGRSGDVEGALPLLDVLVPLLFVALVVTVAARLVLLLLKALGRKKLGECREG